MNKFKILLISIMFIFTINSHGYNNTEYNNIQTPKTYVKFTDIEYCNQFSDQAKVVDLKTNFNCQIEILKNAAEKKYIKDSVSSIIYEKINIIFDYIFNNKTIASIYKNITIIVICLVVIFELIYLSMNKKIYSSKNLLGLLVILYFPIPLALLIISAAVSFTLISVVFSAFNEYQILEKTPSQIVNFDKQQAIVTKVNHDLEIASMLNLERIMHDRFLINSDYDKSVEYKDHLGDNAYYQCLIQEQAKWTIDSKVSKYAYSTEKCSELRSVVLKTDQFKGKMHDDSLWLYNNLMLSGDDLSKNALKLYCTIHKGSFKFGDKSAFYCADFDLQTLMKEEYLPETFQNDYKKIHDNLVKSYTKYAENTDKMESDLKKEQKEKLVDLRSKPFKTFLRMFVFDGIIDFDSKSIKNELFMQKLSEFEIVNKISYSGDTENWQKIVKDNILIPKNASFSLIENMNKNYGIDNNLLHKIGINDGLLSKNLLLNCVTKDFDTCTLKYNFLMKTPELILMTAVPSGISYLKQGLDIQKVKKENSSDLSKIRYLEKKRDGSLSKMRISIYTSITLILIIVIYLHQMILTPILKTFTGLIEILLVQFYALKNRNLIKEISEIFENILMTPIYSLIAVAASILTISLFTSVILQLLLFEYINYFSFIQAIRSNIEIILLIIVGFVSVVIMSFKFHTSLIRMSDFKSTKTGDLQSSQQMLDGLKNVK